jgi:hypothetical protein
MHTYINTFICVYVYACMDSHVCLRFSKECMHGCRCFLPDPCSALRNCRAASLLLPCRLWHTNSERVYVNMSMCYVTIHRLLHVTGCTYHGYIHTHTYTYIHTYIQATCTKQGGAPFVPGVSASFWINAGIFSCSDVFRTCTSVQRVLCCIIRLLSVPEILDVVLMHLERKISAMFVCTSTGHEHRSIERLDGHARPY